MRCSSTRGSGTRTAASRRRRMSHRRSPSSATSGQTGSPAASSTWTAGRRPSPRLVMIRQSSYSKRDLPAHGFGKLGQGPGDAKPPAPPFLMFDRIVRVDEDGGAHKRGSILAEKDVVYD